MASHKWWRITNIVARTDPNNISVAEIRFINEQGVVSNNPTKGFANSYLTSNYTPDKAFDGNSATFSHCISFNVDLQTSGTNWIIGYQFDTAVNVSSVGVQSRQDMQPEWGQEWQTADIEVSDDGVNWSFYGSIAPRVSVGDLSLVVASITGTLSSLSISKQSNTSFLNVYTSDESGSLSGVVTQGMSGEPKTPLKAEVLLYDRMTNQLIQRIWSDNTGAYSFNGLDAWREYYAVTLHPNRTYNAAIQDGLKSGMTS